MKWKKYIYNLIVYIWIGLVGLFIYMWSSPLEFANKTVYGSALSLLGLTPIYYAFFEKKKKNDSEKIFSVVFSLAIGVLFSFFNSTSWGGTFKTQFITHRSKQDHEYRIESQMMDMGSLGYRERTVAVKDIFFLFKWVAPIDNGMIDLRKWQEVNEYVNELELTKRENNGLH